jgi:hypothetical protein
MMPGNLRFSTLFLAFPLLVFIVPSPCYFFNIKPGKSHCLAMCACRRRPRTLFARLWPVLCSDLKQPVKYTNTGSGSWLVQGMVAAFLQSSCASSTRLILLACYVQVTNH